MPVSFEQPPSGKKKCQPPQTQKNDVHPKSPVPFGQAPNWKESPQPKPTPKRDENSHNTVSCESPFNSEKPLAALKTVGESGQLLNSEEPQPVFKVVGETSTQKNDEHLTSPVPFGQPPKWKERHQPKPTPKRGENSHNTVSCESPVNSKKLLAALKIVGEPGQLLNSDEPQPVFKVVGETSTQKNDEHPTSPVPFGQPPNWKERHQPKPTPKRGALKIVGEPGQLPNSEEPQPVFKVVGETSTQKNDEHPPSPVPFGQPPKWKERHQPKPTPKRGENSHNTVSCESPFNSKNPLAALEIVEESGQPLNSEEPQPVFKVVGETSTQKNDVHPKSPVPFGQAPNWKESPQPKPTPKRDENSHNTVSCESPFNSKKPRAALKIVGDPGQLLNMKESQPVSKIVEHPRMATYTIDPLSDPPIRHLPVSRHVARYFLNEAIKLISRELCQHRPTEFFKANIVELITREQTGTIDEILEVNRTQRRSLIFVKGNPKNSRTLSYLSLVFTDKEVSPLFNFEVNIMKNLGRWPEIHQTFAVLLHELGHLFGAHHATEGVMSGISNLPTDRKISLPKLFDETSLNIMQCTFRLFNAKSSVLRRISSITNSLDLKAANPLVRIRRIDLLNGSAYTGKFFTPESNQTSIFVLNLMYWDQISIVLSDTSMVLINRGDLMI